VLTEYKAFPSPRGWQHDVSAVNYYWFDFDFDFSLVRVAGHTETTARVLLFLVSAI
jgi:hypothetical protein